MRRTWKSCYKLLYPRARGFIYLAKYLCALPVSFPIEILYLTRYISRTLSSLQFEAIRARIFMAASNVNFQCRRFRRSLVLPFQWCTNRPTLTPRDNSLVQVTRSIFARNHISKYNFENLFRIRCVKRMFIVRQNLISCSDVQVK